MYALVLAITFRQVVPARSAAQYPQHAVHKQPVVSRGPAHMFLASRQKILDLLPLHITQLVTARHTPTSAASSGPRKVYMSIPPSKVFTDQPPASKSA